MLSTLVPIALGIAAVAAFALLSPGLGRWSPRQPRHWANSHFGRLALVACAAFPAAGLMAEWYGVDLSWRLGLTWATERGLVHGREVLYTYGPLHFLSTRLPPWRAGWLLVGSDAALWLTTLWLAHHVLRHHQRPWVAAILLALACGAGGRFSYGHDWPFTGLWVCWTLAALSVRDGAWLPGALALGFGALLAFVKLNTGLVAITIVVPLLSLAAWRAQHARLSLAVPVVAAAFVLLAVAVLPVDLLAYVQQGLAQVGGYVDTMTLLPAEAGMLAWFAVGTSLVALACLAAAHGGRSDRTLVDSSVVAVALLGLLLAFKQGFTRADPGHIGIFLRASLPFLWIPVGLGGPVRAPAFALAMICALPLVAVHERHLRPAGLFEQAMARARYVRDLPALLRGAPDDHLWPVLPPALRAAVDVAHVDVLPADTALLREVPASWHPRPAFQDIVVVTAANDAANERFYRSAAAPTAVLMRLGDCNAGDGCRQAESRTRLAIVDRFQPTHVGRDYAWLKRRPHPLGLRRVSSVDVRLVWDQPLPIPGTPRGAWILRAEIRLSPLGRLARLLLAPPQVLLELGRPWRAPVVEPASASRLIGGVLVSPLITSRPEQMSLLEAGPASLPGTTTITLRTPQAWAVASTVTASLEAIVPQERAAPVPGDVAVEVPGLWGTATWPQGAPPGTPDPQCQAGQVDRVWAESGQWFAEGWAVLPDAPADGVQAWSDGRVIGRALTMGERLDVLLALGHGRGLMSGWRMELGEAPSAGLTFAAVDGRTGRQTPLCVAP